MSSTTCGILEEFEIKTGMMLPNYLKNLLIFSGYDNAELIKKIDMKKDIEDVENVARNVLPNLYQGDELRKYLGDFYKSPCNFMILPGLLKIVDELIRFSKKYSLKKLENDTPQKALNENYCLLCKQRIVTDECYNTIGNTSTTANDTIVQNHLLDYTPKNYFNGDFEQMISKKITYWTKNYVKNLPNINNDYLEHLPDAVEATLNETDGNVCFIRCFICNKRPKIYRAAGGSWLYSNFYKHFTKHCDINPNEKTTRRTMRSWTISDYLEKAASLHRKEDRERIKMEDMYCEETMTNKIEY